MDKLKQAWVVGLGGLGVAVCKALQLKSYSVVAITRELGGILPENCDVQVVPANLQAIEAFVQQQKANLPDYIINCNGLLHNAKGQPEKKMAQLQIEWLEENFQANLYTSIYWLQALSNLMTRSSKLVYCALSARVGSISDNNLGGWYSYRISKAALNMLIKTTAIEWRTKFPNTVVCGYHPGTVETRLSQPYTATLDAKQLFSAEKAAQYLVNVLTTLPITASGQCLDWQGKVIAP